MPTGRTDSAVMWVECPIGTERADWPTEYRPKPGGRYPVSRGKPPSTQGRLTTTVAPRGTSTIIQLTGVPTTLEVVLARTGRPFTFKEETLPENVACQNRDGPERFVSELS